MGLDVGVPALVPLVDAQILLLIFVSHAVEILVHVLFNVPYHQTGIVHAGPIVPSREDPRVDRIPSESHAVPRVLNHAARDEHLLHLRRARCRLRKPASLAFNRVLTPSVDQRNLPVLVCC